MKDMVTNGTGNSRYLKSSLASGTSWADALALLRAGTFPIDLAGLNNGGITQVGSAYSKANVLPQDVCTALGLNDNTAEPKDAFALLGQKAQIQVGSYVGTGTYGSENENSLAFQFPPKCVIVEIGATTSSYNYTPHIVWVSPSPIAPNGATATSGSAGANLKVTTSVSDNSFSWYGTSAERQLNENGKSYYYIAIG